MWPTPANSGRVWPGVGQSQAESGFGPDSSNSGRMSTPSSAKFGANSAEVGPMLAQTARVQAKQRPTSPRNRPTWGRPSSAKFGRNRATAGRCWPKLGRNGPHLGPELADIERSWAVHFERWAGRSGRQMLDQCWPTWAKVFAKFGKCWPSCGDLGGVRPNVVELGQCGSQFWHPIVPAAADVRRRPSHVRPVPGNFWPTLSGSGPVLPTPLLDNCSLGTSGGQLWGSFSAAGSSGVG